MAKQALEFLRGAEMIACPMRALRIRCKRNAVNRGSLQGRNDYRMAVASMPARSTLLFCFGAKLIRLFAIVCGDAAQQRMRKHAADAMTSRGADKFSATFVRRRAADLTDVKDPVWTCLPCDGVL
jgi:hypothetical protein